MSDTTTTAAAAATRDERALWDLPHLHAELLKQGLQNGLSPEPGRIGWRGQKLLACSAWQPGSAKDPARHVLSVLKVEGTGPGPAFADLWPHKASVPQRGPVSHLLKMLRLADAKLVIGGASISPEEDRKVLKEFDPLARKWDGDFALLDFKKLREDPGALPGLHYEGRLGFGAAAGHPLCALGFEAKADAKAPLVAGRIFCVCPGLDADDDEDDEAISFVHLLWRAGFGDEKPVVLGLGESSSLSLHEAGLAARLDAQGQAVQSLHGAADLTLAGKTMGVRLAADLAREEASLQAEPALAIDLAWIKKLVGADAAEDAAEQVKQLQGGAEACLMLEELGGTVSWAAGLKITQLTLTIAMDAKDKLGVPLAGGRLKPRLTVLCDFAKPKTEMDIEASGVMAWEKLKLSARMRSRDSTYEAALQILEPANDPLVEQFMGKENVLPEERATAVKPREAGTPARPRAGLALKLSGKYGKNPEYHFIASNEKGYEIPIVKAEPGKMGKDLTLKLSDLRFEGSFAPATREGDPPGWDVAVSGKAALSKLLAFEVKKSSFKSDPKLQALVIHFEAKDIDFDEIFGSPRPGHGARSAVVAAATSHLKDQAQAAKNGDKKPTSLEAKWTRKKTRKSADGPWASSNEFEIILKPEAVNLKAAFESLLGQVPDGVEDASLELDSITLLAGTKGTLLKLQAKKGLELQIHSTTFKIAEVAFSAGDREEERKHEAGKTADGASGKAKLREPKSADADGERAAKKRDFAVKFTGKANFGDWGRAAVSFQLPGRFEASTTIKKISLHKVTESLCGGGASDWNLNLVDATFTIFRDGAGAGASLAAEVEGLGGGSVVVMKSGSSWGLGMHVEMDGRKLRSRADELKNAGRPAGRTLADTVVAFMEEISLQKMSLTFCTMDMAEGPPLSGSGPARWEQGFILAADWDLARQTGTLRRLASALKLQDSQNGQDAAPLSARLVLKKSEQSLKVTVPQVPVNGAVRIGGSLELKRTTGALALTMDATGTGLSIGGTRCVFSVALQATLSTDPSLCFLGTLRADDESLDGIPLGEGTNVKLMEAGLMIGVNSAGLAFGAWGSLSIGTFKASAIVFFRSPGETVVAFAISDVSLAQVIGGLFAGAPAAKMLERIRLLGTPLRNAKAGDPQPPELDDSVPKKPSGKKQALMLARALRDRDAKGCADLREDDEVECVETEGTWHLTDRTTLTQYTLRKADSRSQDWELVRKCQFRAVSASIKVGGTEYKQGLFLNARLDIMGWKASALVDIRKEGVHALGTLDPLHIEVLGIKVLSLTAYERKPGPELGASKDGALLSFASFGDAARKSPVAVPANSRFPADFFQKPHVYVNAYLEFLGMVKLAVHCQLSENGMDVEARINVLDGALKGDLAITAFADSGVSVGLALEATIDPVDLWVLTTPQIHAGGFLKLQAGGPDAALAAGLGAHFAVNGSRYSLGSLQVSMSNDAFKNMRDMLKNAVIDGMLARLGLQESKNLQEKNRWIRVEILNDTPYTLNWVGDVDKDIAGRADAHGKYWQKPHDVAPGGSCCFSASNRANALTGCGGVAPFIMHFGGRKHLHFNVAFSNALYSTLGEGVLDVASKALTLVPMVAVARFGWQWITGDDFLEVAHKPKCRAAFAEVPETTWRYFGERYIAPTSDSTSDHQTSAPCVLEAASLPGWNSRVIVREKGVITARHVMTAGLDDAGEMAIVSPAGLLLCKSWDEKMYRWTDVNPPPGQTRAVHKALLFAHRLGQQSAFVLMIVTVDGKTFQAVKMKGQASWNPFVIGDQQLLPMPSDIALAQNPDRTRTSVCYIHQNGICTLMPAGFTDGGTKVAFESTSTCSSRKLRDVIICQRANGPDIFCLASETDAHKSTLMYGWNRRNATCPTTRALPLFKSAKGMQAGLADREWDGLTSLDDYVQTDDALVELLRRKGSPAFSRASDHGPAGIRKTAAVAQNDILCVLVVDQGGGVWWRRHAECKDLRSRGCDPARYDLVKDVEVTAAYMAGQRTSKGSLRELLGMPFLSQMAGAQLAEHVMRASRDNAVTVFPGKNSTEITPDFREWEAWRKLDLPAQGDGMPRRATHLAATLSPHNNLELFAIDQGGGLWHNWSKSQGASWEGWCSTTIKNTPKVSAVSCSIGRNGALDVFIVTLDRKRPWHTCLRKGIGWADWTELKPG